MSIHFMKSPCWIRCLLGLLLLLCASAPLRAHSTGENYFFLNFREASIEGVFEIHFDELASVLEIDTAGKDPEALVEGAAEQVQKYILSHFSIGAEGADPYEIVFTTQGVLKIAQGEFAQYHFRCETGPLPDRLIVENTMCFETNRLHRGLLCVMDNIKTGVNYGDEGHIALVFSATNTRQVLDLTNLAEVIGPRDMIKQGVLHIWIGVDHILFLIALLLPTVLLVKEGKREPVEGFPKAFWNILKVVTIFTVSHSLTLLLAALGYLDVSSQLVESIIALSIILVALNNIFGKVKDGSLWIILFLGLFHGLGFASVMGHLPFRMEKLVKIVIGFNIGVELGQMAIVAALFPVLFFLRKKAFYVPVFLKGGSAVLVVVASYWFIQRAFGWG